MKTPCISTGCACAAKSVGIKIHIFRSAILLSIAALAHGAQPPDVVQGDVHGNTAMGNASLSNLTTGVSNTAAGSQTLAFTTEGSANTATGDSALYSNTSGNQNTAYGVATLSSSTTGSLNTAVGAYALATNATGDGNNAVGVNAMALNTTGHDNSAMGISTIYSNTTGSSNVGLGNYALTQNTSGGYNTAAGTGALSNNTTGSGNIAIGINGGANLTTGDNNIDIGNGGSAGESGTIRVGAAGAQSKTFVAGIWGSQVKPGLPVFVTSDGHLGVVGSSERYKTDIAPLGSVSERLLQLRPVTFRLKTDPSGDAQFGLIAEEVASVYPELVIRDDQGKIEGVRYDELAPILLSEVQQQEKLIATQAEQLSELRQQFVDLKETAATLQRALGELQGTASGNAVH